MPIFLWNPISISLLSQLILAVVIACYFAWNVWSEWKRGVSRGLTAWLFVGFLSFSLFLLCGFLKAVLHPDFQAFVLPWASIPGVLAIISVCALAYRFPARLPVTVLEKWLFRLVCSSMLALEGYVLLVRLRWFAQGYVEYRPAWMDHFMVGGLVWAMVIFARQYFTARAGSDGPPAARRRREASLALFLFCLAPLALNLMLLLRSLWLIGPVTTEIANVVITIVLLTAFTLIYLNYVPERSSFLIKLSGITLATMLVILGSVSWLISPVYSDAYRSSNFLQSQTALRFEPDGEGGYRLNRTGYNFDEVLGEKLTAFDQPIDLPFSFPFYGTEWDTVFIKEDGFLSFHDWIAWRDVAHRYGSLPAIIPLAVSLDGEEPDGSSSHGVYLKSASDRVTVTWDANADYTPGQSFAFQAVLYPKGVIEFAYRQIPRQPDFSLLIIHATPWFRGITPGYLGASVERLSFAGTMPVAGQPMHGLIEDYRLDFLLYLNRVYRPLAWFVFITSIVTLIAFPLFFVHSLVRPLNSLLRGVRQFRTGARPDDLPVKFRDEIGYLTQSFSEMAKDQFDLVESLEDRVAERSREVSRIAAENARLQERNRLSGDLHDAVSQSLFSSALIAEALEGQWLEDPEKGMRQLALLRELNVSALTEMRQLLIELRPRALTDRPLSVLLAELIEGFRSNNDLPVSLDMSGRYLLPGDVQVSFLRTAQEGLGNIVKHARATTASIQFDCTPDSALLTIEDNGLGFDRDSGKEGHFGLDIMQDRADKIGATLEIDSRPGHGTRITLVWMRGGDDEADRGTADG